MTKMNRNKLGEPKIQVELLFYFMESFASQTFLRGDFAMQTLCSLLDLF
jgi:hypothetical protein